MVTEGLIDPANPEASWLEEGTVLVKSESVTIQEQRRRSAFYASVPRVFCASDAIKAPRRQERLDEIKILRRLIIVCAWCNRIRDSEGVWRQPQVDLQADAKATLSHGICPPCAEQSYNAYRYGGIRVDAATLRRSDNPPKPPGAAVAFGG